MQTRSQGKPTRMKSSVSAFGLVMQVFPDLLSTPIPLLYCLGLRQRLSVPLQHFIAVTGESSFCPMIPSVLPMLLNRCCWISTGPPTGREQDWDAGIAKCWKESGRTGMVQKWEWGNGEIISFSDLDSK